jgi:Transposase DDE domain
MQLNILPFAADVIFAEGITMSAFEREACQRLPLAEAALRLLDYALRDEFLAQVFERHSGACYEKVITFPVLVHLIADALLEHRGSGHKSFTRAQENGTLAASIVAAYGKLRRVPIALSCGLLADTTPRLVELLPKPATAVLPPSLRGFSVLALDGKKIKYVAKRLKALRKIKGHVLGGKLVAAQEVTSGLALGLTADPDGEAGDAALVPDVVAQVRAVRPGPRLWLADRGFCDLIQPHQLGADGDHYVIRYNAKVSFTADPERPAQSGCDAAGRAYTDEWGWLGKGPKRIEVRRVTLQRPGAEAVIVVTDLRDAKAYPAVDILAVYLLRWGIEHMFQDITEVFQLRHLIGSTPEATVFQAAFCLLLYNVIVVMRAYLATAKRPVEKISGEKLFYDVERELVAWQEVIGPEQTLEVLGEPLPTKQLKKRLQELLTSAWSELWWKAKPKKQAVQHPHKEYLKGGHNSVYRLLQEAKLAQQKAAQGSACGPTAKKSERPKAAGAGAKRC